MAEDKIRITFACSTQLRELLTKRADKEGIPRSQLIVELLEGELNSPTEGKTRDAAINRLMYDIQQRVGELEAWKRAFAKMTEAQIENSENLEQSVAYLLNENASSGGADVGKTISKKKSIPTPKK